MLLSVTVFCLCFFNVVGSVAAQTIDQPEMFEPFNLVPFEASDLLTEDTAEGEAQKSGIVTAIALSAGVVVVLAVGGAVVFYIKRRKTV